MNGLEMQYSEQVQVIYLNALAEGAAAFEVGSFPGHPAVVILMPDGEEIWRGFGVIAEQDIENAIQKALQHAKQVD